MVDLAVLLLLFSLFLVQVKQLNCEFPTAQRNQARTGPQDETTSPAWAKYDVFKMGGGNSSSFWAEGSLRNTG